MNSSTILRRAALLQAAARRSAPQTSVKALGARPYATPAQEPDPQLNGYPELPWVPRATLPARGWDDMLERRNFGETVHEYDDILSMWGPDVPSVDPQIALRQFLISVGAFVAFGFAVKYVLTPEAPAVRRQYPFNGLVKELGGLEENKARPESLDDSE